MSHSVSTYRMLVVITFACYVMMGALRSEWTPPTSAQPLTFSSPSQKQACMLIRNLVARSQAFSQPILDLGAEALILRARATHRDCEDVAKAALRDLGCRVELRELWTGQKGNLAP